MSDAQSETTHVDADGLRMPPALRTVTGQIVFRTPRATIQHFQSGGGETDAYYPLIDETHFGRLEELDAAQNPELAPNRVSIKPRGETPRVFEVTLDV